VLRHPEVVERHGEQDRVSGKELVHQLGGEPDGGLLLWAALVLGCPSGRGGGGPGVARQRLAADVSPLDHVTGVGFQPLALDDVGDLAAG
jgi:hypothetical protein